jgi:hypothetical protein
MGYDKAHNFIKNSSLILLHIWNPQPAFAKLLVFLLLLLLFIYLFLKEMVNLGRRIKK